LTKGNKIDAGERVTVLSRLCPFVSIYHSLNTPLHLY
jgi:hypothetical protein